MLPAENRRCPKSSCIFAAKKGLNLARAGGGWGKMSHIRAWDQDPQDRVRAPVAHHAARLIHAHASVGESQNQPFQLSFNASLKVDFQGSRVTSDGGLILVRELAERLGFGEFSEQHLIDSRAKNTRLPFADLLRQSGEKFPRRTLNQDQRPVFS
jgi:hypothetical protein